YTVSLMDPARESILATYGIPMPLSRTSRNSNGGGPPNRRGTTDSRTSKRYSMTMLYSMAAEQDVEVEDDLAK
ncbi:17929_t:CDS:1, partial [Racocetra fulgida]